MTFTEFIFFRNEFLAKLQELKVKIEWKESWRDEYLKCICGFANAQGGKIYIGIKDDGRVIGVKNSKSDFIMKRAGVHWEDAIVEGITLNDIDVIYLKYLKAAITYDYDRRAETYPYARDVIREAIYNALVHNCYMFGSPIQIRISDEEMRISNSCILPSGWRLETLLGPHTSEPYNPNIARYSLRYGPR